MIILSVRYPVRGICGSVRGLSPKNMINIKCYDENVKSIFEKYIHQTGLKSDNEFYRSVLNVEDDVNFFQEFMNRTNKSSNYSFKPQLSIGGLIQDGFMKKINNHFNYYEYSLLGNHLYILEILKRLFSNWINEDCKNEDYVKYIIEFHVVVKYYIELQDVSDYAYDFIGSSYMIGLFFESVEKLTK